MIKCAIYPRKSKASDNSQSMEQQISDCTRYIEEHCKDYTITLYDGDYALSGHSTKKRKDFQRMMNDVRSGQINLVVIIRYDRIARNMRDFCNLFHDMEEAGCNLVSVSQQIDTSTPYGKNFMYQMAAMAELEWAIISERYKDTAKYKKEHGYAYTGRVAWGYKIERQADGKKRVVKDPDHPANEVFDFYRKHKNKIQTVLFAKNNYDPKFTYDVLRDMFRTNMYTGKVPGNPNFCEPYYTEKEFEEIRNIRVIHKTESGRVYLFSSLIECPICGKNMVAYAAGKDHAFKYYRCGYYSHEFVHDGILANEESIEKQLVRLIDKFLDRKISISSKQQKKPSKRLTNEEIQVKKDRLNYMFEKGRIGIEEYDKKYAELDAMIEPETPQEYVAIKGVLSPGWKEMYKALDDSRKKLFWHNIIKKIKINEEKEIVDVIF